MDLAACLVRLGLAGPLPPTADSLRRLHVAQLTRVPFETLDVSAGASIVLDEEAFFEKIVQRRRGGYCYELNGFLAALLRELGFSVGLLSAEVAKPDGSFGPEFDHLALRVELDEPWLADVGFGDGFLEPLRLVERGEQRTPDGAWRLEEAEGGRLLLQRLTPEGEWRPAYRLDLEPHALADFDGMNRFHQSSPDSPFAGRRLCSLARLDGRDTLSGLKLVRTRGAERVVRELADETEVAATLRDLFGVELQP